MPPAVGVEAAPPLVGQLAVRGSPDAELDARVLRTDVLEY